MVNLILAAACLLISSVICINQEIYSSGFQQPKPPLIIDEFSANFMQHKWNNIISHVTSGVIYMSAANNKVRVDNTHDGIIQASLFDYNNVTSQGLLNKNYILEDLTKKPKCQYTFITIPAFPLLKKTILQENSAVFAGFAQDELYGKVEIWNIFYSGVPVSIFIDSKKRFVRYDFWVPNERTFTTTRFYNIQNQKQPQSLFNLPC